MMYKYVGSGYYPGLPACDLDAETLTPEQLALLAAGAESGMYILDKPARGKNTPRESVENDRGG